MGVKVGKNAKVTLGTYTVSKMGKWSLDGITTDLLESTAFGDSYKQFELGISDYGTVSFDGFYDPDDSTGQTLLESALLNASKIGNAIKFYIDASTYFTPNVTSVSAAGILVQQYTIGFDKSGIGTITFSCKATGPMVLTTG